MNFDSDKINEKLKFLDELEKFATVKRVMKKSNGELENDAEHSWYLAMFVMTFREEIEKSNPGIDYTKLLELALIHDLPEIYAGDMVPFSKDFDPIKKKENEELAGKKLYGFLSGNVKKRFIDLFEDYENLKSSESEIVKALDKVQPDHMNLLLEGGNWEEFELTFEKLDNYKREHIMKNIFTRSLYYDFIIKSALEKGFLREK